MHANYSHAYTYKHMTYEILSYSYKTFKNFMTLYDCKYFLFNLLLVKVSSRKNMNPNIIFTLYMLNNNSVGISLENIQ